jgi:DNA primase
MRIRSDRPTANGGWLHTFGDTYVAPAKPIIKKPVKSEIISHIERRDAIYSTLLRGHLVLSSEHRDALKSRGLSDEEITRLGYHSAPSPEHGRFVAKSLAEHGLEGTPGFYRVAGEWRMRDFGAGIFLPVRDEHARIQGFQIRRDNPGDGAKYIWFSSANYAGGTSSGSPVHYSKPHLVKDADEVVITEGALKSDIVAHFLGQPVIAAAGVNNFGATFAEDLHEKFPHIKTATIAFDSDFKTKAPVRLAMDTLRTQLRRAGFKVNVALWPDKWKGLDDYLLATAQPVAQEEVAA